MRREQLIRAGLKADQYPPLATSPADVPADMTIADWLKARWTSADETVRHSLQVLADALGIDVPLRRTQPIPPKDSSPARRTKFPLQPYVEQDPLLASPAEKEEPGYHDPPEWDDELADGWVPSESLHDALHDALDPEDRGWF